MKKFLVFLCAMCVLSARATTVDIDWLMDGATYAQTTCETGGNFALPSPTPTKYGYHFVGWQQIVVGSWSQSGVPSPTNPIEPTFRQFGNTVLRAVGTGDYIVADSYTTGKITRRVGVKVLDGTEDWRKGTSSMFLDNVLSYPDENFIPYCTHFKGVLSSTGISDLYSMKLSYVDSKTKRRVYIYPDMTLYATANDFKQWLADQYAAGTPVTIYYPLATPVEENYNAQ